MVKRIVKMKEKEKTVQETNNNNNSNNATADDNETIGVLTYLKFEQNKLPFGDTIQEEYCEKVIIYGYLTVCGQNTKTCNSDYLFS